MVGVVGTFLETGTMPLLGEQFMVTFRDFARVDGRAAEEFITELYTRLSSRWANAIVVDGGAHVGYHTFRLAELKTVERVLAVEASAQIAATLTANMAASPVGEKIQLKEAALQEDPQRGSIEFLISLEHPGRSGVNPVMADDPNTHYEAPVTVPATTLDQELGSELDRVAFIKLDLEGGEYSTLKGAREVLSQSTPVVVFEKGVNAPELYNYRIEDLFEYLDDVGLEARTFFGDLATTDNAADFWYAWAFPKGQFADFESDFLEAMKLISARHLGNAALFN